METFEQFQKEYKEKRQIKCPHCNVVQMNDDNQYPVTYHGSEEGAQEWECDTCGEKFFVEEKVERTYKVGIEKDEFGEIKDTI